LSLSKVRPRFCVYKTHPPTQAPSRGVFVGKIVGDEIDQATQLVSVVSSVFSSVPLEDGVRSFWYIFILSLTSLVIGEHTRSYVVCFLLQSLRNQPFWGK